MTEETPKDPKERPLNARLPDPANPERDEDEDFVNSMSEEFMDSFLGGEREKLLREKKTSPGFWAGLLKILYRLIMPRANQWFFVPGFWTLRIVGLLILISWGYFGMQNDVWDREKLVSGLAILFLGPLVLRGCEFILEALILKGASKDSWRNFWNFKRMMTPRSIQTAFFIGFWFLVISGGTIVFSGFRDLIASERVGSFEDALKTSLENFDEAGETANNLLESDNPLMGYLRNKLKKSTLQELMESREDKTALSSEARQNLMEELRRASESKKNSFARIFKGLLLMILGPMALRFTAESIILFFRINETLTDISKQLEQLNRKTGGPDPKESSRA